MHWTERTIEMKDPWKLRMAAVACCLTLILFLSAFLRTSRLLNPVDAWINQVRISGDWKTWAAWACAAVIVGLLAEFVINRWRKP